jgi:hypothetical protein
MDEGRKRVLGIMAAILASLHMRTADDLFGGPTGSPRSDKLIAASVQWAEEIMRKIDQRISPIARSSSEAATTANGCKLRTEVEHMKDHGVALSDLAKQAPFVNLTPIEEERVLQLIKDIKDIFDRQAKKKAS